MIATATDPARARARRGRARAGRVGGHAGDGRASGCAPTPACRSTCGSSRPTSSATCSSTSPAPRSTTWRCATRRSARACTSPSTACSTTPPARRTAARPRRRSTRCSASSTSSPSCARTAASSRRPPAGTLPELIELGDLRGDLHCHTTASDGTASIEEMAAAARDAGYEYLAITDHSASMGFGARPLPRATARADRADPRDGGRRDRAARRLRGQHPPRRLARLRRRRAGRARLGDRERPLLVPDALRGR